MAEDSKTPNKTAPYIPFKSFIGFADRLNSTAVPPIIDGSVLHTMSGSMKSQLMSSLRFMGLIDIRGTVSVDLKSLIKSYKTDAWKESLSNIVFDAYTDVIGDVDLDTGTAQQLNEAFRLRGNVEGQMLEKAVRFYLAALAECGASVSPHFTAKRARKPAPRKKSKKKTKSGNGSNDIPDLDIEDDVSGMAKFRIPIPGKRDGIILLPDDINRGDWVMVKTMLDAYVSHLTSDEED